MATTSDTPALPRLAIDVWVDVVCPWCYLGEERLGKAAAQFDHAEALDLRVHTFQLDPTATDEARPLLDYLAAKYGLSAEEARANEEAMARRAEAEGLPFAVDRTYRSTFDMLRLLHLGAAHGVAWEYLRAMQIELFGGNPEAYEPSTLVRLGEGLGIPGDEIRDVLASDRYATEVRADHEAAVAMGARGVPFAVLGERLGIPGAASTAQYAEAIGQAWEQVNGPG